jgi:hypothetical protein
MAASSWREASSWHKSGIILVGGAAVAALAWCSYKRYISNAYQDLPVDEGFDENSKVSAICQLKTCLSFRPGTTNVLMLQCSV